MKPPFKFAIISCANWRGKVKNSTANIFDWLLMWDGDHVPHEELNKDITALDNYDICLLLDADRYLDLAIKIAKESKCKTIFYAEGTLQTYLRMPFQHQEKFYELLQHVDLVGTLEEDLVQWYEAVAGAKAFFMHTPTSDDMVSGRYRKIPKQGFILVCCNLGMDNERHQTNLISSLGVLKKTDKFGVLCEARPEQMGFYRNVMKVKAQGFCRLHPFFYVVKLVAPAKILLSPSAIIGTSRNAIVGAATGTPVIGSRDSHTQNKLWPKLARYRYDVKGMSELVNRLYDDEVFYKEVCEYAFSQLPYYSVESTKRRFLEAVEGL